MFAIQATKAGGPEVLVGAELPAPTPGPGQLLVRTRAIGVNFIDTYFRSGAYSIDFPHIPGSEGSGEVVAVGDGVDASWVGRPVAWTDSITGSYAEQVLLAPERTIVVPAGMSWELAAALPMQGMTAHYLTRSTFEVSAGQDVLVHAAAGGMGQLLCQMCSLAGARVIGTVSTQAKAEAAREAGASEVVRYDQMSDLSTELPAAVRELTGGRGVHVVYDGVGKSTFDASLASLRRRGMLVVFGAASGPVPPFDLQRLNSAGSIFVTRPSLFHYIATEEELRWRSEEVFTAANKADLKVHIGIKLPLSDAARAHTALAGRSTTGKVLLMP